MAFRQKVAVISRLSNMMFHIKSMNGKINVDIVVYKY